MAGIAPYKVCQQTPIFSVQSGGSLNGIDVAELTQLWRDATMHAQYPAANSCSHWQGIKDAAYTCPGVLGHLPAHVSFQTGGCRR